jgi:hypothetical protein
MKLINFKAGANFFLLCLFKFTASLTLQVHNYSGTIFQVHNSPKLHPKLRKFFETSDSEACI